MEHESVSSAKDSGLRILMVGAVLPAVLALANRQLLSPGTIGYYSGPLVAAPFGFYVLQLACVSWAVATYVRLWPLRWIIYGWTLLLIDLQLAVLTQSVYSDAVRCLASGLLAGQLSLFVVWGVLSRDALVWRLPALLVLVVVCWNFYGTLVLMQQQSWDYLHWSDLVLMQTVLLAVLCGCLRLAGFGLEIVASDREAALASERPQALQFGIRDVLIATTILAIVLAAGKAGDLLTLQFVRQFYDRGLLLVLIIAVSTALVLIVALWSALGRGHIVFRAATLLFVSLAVGGPLAWYCVHIGQPTAQTSRFLPNFPYWLDVWYRPGYWWLGWMFLAGAVLAASLLVYRTLGYRLVRTARGRQPARALVLQPATASSGS